MTDKLRAVIAGCGGICCHWLNMMKDIAEVEVVGLVDLDESTACQRKTDYELVAAETGTDLAAMIDRTRPDAVFDLTIPEAHHAVVLTALAKGCHVLGEKPLAASLAQAKEMVAAAQQAGKVYSVIQNRRYDRRIRRVRQAVSQGLIGDLTTVNCDFYIGAHFGGFRERMEHVLLLDMAIHTFDAARYLSGADPVAVWAKEWNPTGSWYDHDASAIAVFEMSDGIIYTYRGSWCAEGLNTTWECDWRLLGATGTILWDGADNMRGQNVAKPEGFHYQWQDIEFPAPDDPAKEGGHAGLIREFVQCVRNGQQPETAAEDNIKSLAMVFAAIQSAETGQRVEIKL